MDLGKVGDVVAHANDPITFVVCKPNGDPYLAADGKECTWSLLGKESRKYRAARDAITRRNLRSRKPNLEPSDLRANRVSLVLAVTTGWTGWESDGAPAECNQDNIRALLKYDHILDQCEEHIEGHANFFLESSSLSSTGQSSKDG